MFYQQTFFAFFSWSENFSSFFRRYLEETISSSYVGKRINSEKKTHLAISLNFYRKKVFHYLKSQRVLKSSWKMWKVWPKAGFEPATCGIPNCDATPLMYYARRHDSADSLHAMGKIRKWKKQQSFLDGK